jgi:hypothetical protein
VRVLFVCKAPAFQKLCHRCDVGVIAQILCDEEVHHNLLTILHRMAPSTTNALCLAACAEPTHLTRVRGVPLRMRKVGSINSGFIHNHTAKAIDYSGRRIMERADVFDS